MGKTIEFQEDIPEEVIQEEITPEIKSAQFKVLKKEDNCAILSVLGWRMRVYFDETLIEDQISKVTNGKYITVDYIGDLKDVFSVKLQKLITV